MERKKKRLRTTRANSVQLEILVTFMEEHKDFATGKLNSAVLKADRKKYWSKLTEVLNAEGAAYKTKDQWRKCWNDQKAYARAKAARIKQAIISDTPEEKLTIIEERILNLVGWTDTFEDQVPENVVDKLYNIVPVKREEKLNDAEDNETEEEASLHSTQFEPDYTPARRRQPINSSDKNNDVLKNCIKDQNEVLKNITECMIRRNEELAKQTEIFRKIQSTLHNIEAYLKK